jgi:hypothetical protein
MGATIMSSSQKRAVSNHRSRLRQRGLVRLEVSVRKEDVPLVRGVVAALNDPTREDGARGALRDTFGEASGFKDFLLQVPIEGLDLERLDDDVRDIDL